MLLTNQKLITKIYLQKDCYHNILFCDGKGT
jgi:hypothetical protein